VINVFPCLLASLQSSPSFPLAEDTSPLRDTRLAARDLPRKLMKSLHPHDYRGNQVQNPVHWLYVFEPNSRIHQ
jgi:hypothetical protein